MKAEHILDRIKNERGVFVPLTAIMAGVVLFVIAKFAIDSKIVKETRSQAELKLEQICLAARDAIPIMANVVDRVDAAASDLISNGGVNSYSTITRIQIDMPSADLNLPTITPFAPYSLSNPAPFSSMGGGCSECYLGWNIEASSIAANYPNGLITRNQYNGYVACRMEVEVGTVVSSTRTVRVKTVYRTDLKNAAPGGGLLIGIAPQANMDTLADNRFDFDPPNANFDPLNSYPNGAQTFAYARQTRPFRNGNLAFTPAIAALGVNDPGRQDRLSGCYNPLIAARNMLLQHIVGNAARDWKTRDRTSIMLINNQHQDFSGDPNLPTFIVRNGEDMQQPQFQIPFVNYKHDGSEESIGGYLCPWNDMTCNNNKDGDALPDSQEHIQRLNELRDCYFVNNSANGTRTVTDFSVSNANFEPSAHYSLDQVAPAYNAGSFWWDADPANPSLKAEDLVRVLGTIRDCPYDGTSSCHTLEENSALPQRGPKGDIVAFLDFALGNSQGFKAPGVLHPPPSGPPMMASPWENNNDTNSAILIVTHKRLEPSPGTCNPADGTVTTPSAEMTAIRNRMIDINNAGRRAIVVYLATHRDKLAPAMNTQDPEVACDFQWAFDAHPGSNPVGLNTFVRMAPIDFQCLFLGDATCFNNYWEDTLLGTSADNIEQVSAAIYRAMLDPKVTF